jgi:hypothetical protein|tara:strand:- start:458 stop:715 length:258 start_codon:yes stop_codon:yes gene_type:complete
MIAGQIQTPATHTKIMSDYWTGLVNYEPKKKMTDKESKQIDITLACLAMASSKGADKTDMLNALAYDIHMIRKGEDPTEAQKLID